MDERTIPDQTSAITEPDSVFITGRVSTSLTEIAEYFTEQDKSPATRYIAIEVVQIIFGFLGVIGNTLVVLVIFKFTKMRRRLTNLFIINQSLVDITASLCLILTRILSVHSIRLGSIGGEILCRVVLSDKLIFATMMSSTYNLVLLNLERYIQIVHPVAHKTAVRSWKVRAVMAAVWLIGPLYVFSSGIPTTIVIDGRCRQNYQWPSLALKKTFGFLTLILFYFLPLLVFFYTYFCMFRAVRKRRVLIVPSQNVGPSNKQALTPVERNILRTLFIVTLCFVICWTPDEIYFLLFNLGFPFYFHDTFHDISVIMVSANLCLNPLIYITNYGEFRKGVKKLLGRPTEVSSTTQNSSVANETTNAN